MATNAVITLASASPRRRELIALLGIPFAVETSRFNEPPPPDEPVSLSQLVTDLAVSKAREVRGRVDTPLVLGADTLVSLVPGDVGTALGKPRDQADAVRMLHLLSGATHAVFTGVALFNHADEPPLTACVKTRVRFREMTDEQIESYAASGEPMDKAGAYGAQGAAAPYIEGFEGDFFNVVGLPVCTVARLIEKTGLEWWRQGP